MNNEVLRELAYRAVTGMFEHKPVTITRHKDEPRNGLPLPLKKQDPDDQGYITQEYRPMAILEYVNDALSGELARRQAKARREKETT